MNSSMWERAENSCGSRSGGTTEGLDRIAGIIGIPRDQETAWKILVAQLHVCEDIVLAERRRIDPFHRPGLAEALCEEAQALAMRLEIIASLRPAVEQLYGQLTGRQRLLADRLLRSGCGILGDDRHPFAPVPAPEKRREQLGHA